MQTSRVEVAYAARQKLWQVRDLVSRTSHRLADAASRYGLGSPRYQHHLKRSRRIEALALRLDHWFMEQIRKEA